jgi:hypothetical protein
VAVLLLLGVQTIATGALFSPVQVTNAPGFGDKQNSFAWSMAWFNGKLYVGTARNEICVELETLQFYYPDTTYYTTNPERGVTCPKNPYDMDLRAEIWQYTPETGQWLRVYQSPEIPNPRASGKMIARDIAYRGMVVYQGALYVGGVTADEYIPELAGSNPPRILRTTDGTDFTPLNGDPGQVNELSSAGLQYPMGFRSMTVFQDKLFVTASTGLRGDGVIMQVDDPAGSTSTFTQVSPLGTMGVFEIEVFNNQLYAGVGDLDNGYSVWRTDGSGSAPFQFTPVVTGGAGRGKDMTSVVSMHVFQGQLYVGSSGWYTTLLPSSELIRIAPDDSWQLVVGNARQTTDGYKTAISGLPDGFGNIFNAHFWRMDDRSGALLLGTNDWSWQIANPNLMQLFMWQFGFDLYASCDGASWFPVTLNAFGTSQYNFGVRTLQSTSDAEYIGTTNQVQGTEILKWPDNVICQGSTLTGSYGPNANASTNLVPPQSLQADLTSGRTVLSWDSSSGADHYQVLRSATGSAQGQGMTSALLRALSKLPNDLPMLPPSILGGGLSSFASMPQPFTSIGTTKQTTFVDNTAQPGVQYTYEVVAMTGDGQTSSPSNIVANPTTTQEVTFDQIESAIKDLGSSGALTPASQARLTALLMHAKVAAGQSNPAEALRWLTALVTQIQSSSGGISNQASAQDLVTMIKSLERSIMVGSGAP